MIKYFLQVVFLFSTLIVAAQDFNFEETPLETVLEQIRTKHGVSFSYAKDVIDGKTITLVIDSGIWEGILPVFEAQTGLVFNQISDTEVVISPRNSKGKYCGYILDSISKTPLAFASVLLSNGDFIYTNSNGYFAFTKADSNLFTVTSIGYEAKTYTATTSCTSYFLNPSTEGLPEIFITGYVTTGIDRNRDGSLQVTQKSLGILPGLVNADILQSIQLIPGISSLDETVTGIQIRGGSPDQNLVLYDDIKLYNTGYFYGMFSLFNPFATKNATVYRSGTSARYGDRVSGIIDISSGTEIPLKTEGGFELDGLSINGFIKLPLSDNTAVYAFARRSYSHVLETPTYTSYADKIFTNFGVARDINGNVLELETDDDFTRETSNNDFSFSDVSAKLITKPNAKNTISISGLYTHNRLDFDFNGGDELVVDSLITKNKGLSANWNHTTNSKQREELALYYSEYNSFYQNNEIKNETGDGIPNLSEINIRKNDITDLGLKFTSTTKVKKDQDLILGYELTHTNLDVLISEEKPLENLLNASQQDNTNLQNAAFGEYKWRFKNKGIVSGGIRLSHYSSLNMLLIEPRANFEYPLTPNVRFKTAIERRNQPISQLVEFNHTELRLENELWRLSDNKQFPLLSSNQISGGLLYQFKNLNIDIDGYYKDLEGLTTFTNGFSNPLENFEEGKSIIKGIDVLFKYKWDNYKIWAGYTYNDITFQFPNLKDTPLTFPGNNDIRHQFRISSTMKLENWQFSLGWQYRTGKPFTPVNNYEIKIDADGENAGVVDFGSINSARLPDFHRLDASILYDFKIKSGSNHLKSQIGLSLLNIYNRVQPMDLIYKAERKPLDDGGIAVEGTDGSTLDDRQVILEQVIQRFSLGFTPNVSFKVLF